MNNSEGMCFQQECQLVLCADMRCTIENFIKNIQYCDVMSAQLAIPAEDAEKIAG